MNHTLNIQDRQAAGGLLADAHLCGVKLEEVKVLMLRRLA